jgi:putative RNA 2'-phosphotransferase
MTSNSTRLSKRISWLLRHGAGDSHLPMDPAGWARIDDVLGVLGITRAELDTAVAVNDKQRLQVAGQRIRACQGHSLERMPVSIDALEASWELVEPVDPLWHGTNVTAIAGIAQHGIQPGQRSHVHVAPQRDSHVGKRSSVDYLLEIDPIRLVHAGLQIFWAPNGVILVRYVPVAAISGITATSAAGQHHQREALRLLGIGGG